ncbi:MAG: hypothetical protein IPG92_05540 [Flavobacteriales bacterium]|nr:hypothetical protein [Flavobacteriales bacterium]
MGTRRHKQDRPDRRSPRALLEQLLIKPAARKGRKPDTVAFQWLDGAGELHYEVLSPAQSWPYLTER